LTDEGVPYYYKDLLKWAYTGFSDGFDTVHDNEDINLMSFLKRCGVTSESMINIRESCKGARYNTYLIDMISFLYQLYIGTKDFHKIFEVNYRKASASDKVESVGKWTPIEGHSYLYFEETSDSSGSVFFTPKKESVNQIYRDLDSALSPEDNEVKQEIRNHLCNYRTQRWTDFDVNDTDDSFTILMMIHAFSSADEGGKPITLSEVEKGVKDELETVMESWFSQLD
jgi:hypothetical protein